MDELPLYPESDFSQGTDLLVQIGGFWSQFFDDVEILRTQMRNLGALHDQVTVDYDKTVASLSRFQIPVFHTENWYFITLRKSDRNRILNLYGDPLTYGQGSLVYGGPTSIENIFPLPDTPFGPIARAQFTLYNRLVSPSRTLTSGLDFSLDDQRDAIVFRDDPFEDELIAKRDIFDENGALVDEEIGLWLFKGEFDQELVYRHYGFVVKAKQPSSQFYKDMVNALWDMHVAGPTLASLQEFLASVSGNPVIRNDRETVEVIRPEIDRTVVVTDKEFYEFPFDAAIIVAVGDVLFAGDVMSNAAEVIELCGAQQDLSSIAAISLGRGFVSGNFLGELTFENKVVSLNYRGVDEDGKAFVDFEISGFPADVEAFWQRTQDNGKEPGQQTLAELLDTRANPTGQPEPPVLPSTINPLEFMVDNLLRNNLFLMRMRPAAFAAGAPGLGQFKHLRRVIPPHTTYVTIVELEAGTDIIEVDDTTEGAEPFTGVEVPADVISVADITDAVVSAFRVSTTCEDL
jgi:hypothetical protein